MMTAAESAQRTWDALVVGAGPAGSLAACQLARQGFSVLIVDKSDFPRDKVCGGCLSHTALKTLAAVDMQIPAHLGGVKLKQMCLAAAGANADVPLPGGLAISRRVFDSHLVGLAEAAGAQFLPRTTATGTSLQSDDRIVTLQSDGGIAQIRAKIVLAAEGLNGQLLRNDPSLTVRSDAFFGASTTFASHSAAYYPSTIYMACGTGGYVGVVRFGDGSLHVGVALDPRATRQRGIGPVSNHILSQAALPNIPELETAAWKGTPTLTRTRTRVADARLFVIGDAAGYIEPFTGEGMAWALAGGRAVTPFAVRGIQNWSQKLIDQWTHTHHQLVRQRQWVCRLFSRLLRYPQIVGPAVRILRTLPALSTPFTRIVNSPYRAEMFSTQEAS